jgi:hypothetical protein
LRLGGRIWWLLVNWLKFWSDFRDNSHAGEGKGNIWSAGKAGDKDKRRMPERLVSREGKIPN